MDLGSFTRKLLHFRLKNKVLLSNARNLFVLWEIRCCERENKTYENEKRRRSKGNRESDIKREREKEKQEERQTKRQRQR